MMMPLRGETIYMGGGGGGGGGVQREENGEGRGRWRTGHGVEKKVIPCSVVHSNQHLSPVASFCCLRRAIEWQFPDLT